MAKITKVTAADGAVSYVETASTIADQLVDIVTLPLDILKKAADDNEFISRKHASLSVIGGMLAGAEVSARTGFSVGRLFQGM